MKQLLVRLWKEEQGQDLTEYALLLVFGAIADCLLGTLAASLPRRGRQRRGQFDHPHVGAAKSGCVVELGYL